MSTKPLEKIAIIGATGRIGGAFAKALVRTGKHTVTALTRPGGSSKLPEGVKPVEVNYDDEAALVEVLKGQQFLVITLGVRAPADLHGRLCAAAAKAGIRYIMPNVYGYPERQSDDPYSKAVLSRIEEAKNNGATTSIVLACGFWYEWSLGLGEGWFGFTIEDRKVTFFDDGKRSITVSTWNQCGNALAALLSLPEAGASPSLADFANKTVRISSWSVSQRDMLDSLHRVLGTTDADWQIKYEPTAKRIEDGKVQLQKGDTRGFAKQLYGAIFLASNKTSDYARTDGTANAVLGLPQEDLDEATKRTVEMVEGGWDPLGLRHLKD
ncbi:7a9cde9c-5967-48c0-a2b8-b0a2cb97cb91 [Thermothielavioides terrestris]|uniref:7a9cde9c-5967-48c0-a2b8-b0a2cb97cb91 n=1 Tax=Thermothielavioides terrestris TaxID=2587410 RepID=A0A446BQS2_9PEZI|nr:7a9cde9c-5967-48c0-a2b8-b0a2cb97cb91 [Thermothielavioides terrestris]